jgi:phosphocarrier protein HPr
MVQKSIKVINDTGLHARPAALFVQAAGKYTSKIWIEKDEKKVNAKSIMGIMSLGVSKGAIINIGADGPDEVEAVDILIDLIESKFEEK